MENEPVGVECMAGDPCACGCAGDADGLSSAKLASSTRSASERSARISARTA